MRYLKTFVKRFIQERTLSPTYHIHREHVRFSATTELYARAAPRGVNGVEELCLDIADFTPNTLEVLMKILGHLKELFPELPILIEAVNRSEWAYVEGLGFKHYRSGEPATFIIDRASNLNL